MGDKTVSADSINGLTENFGELNGGLALEHFRNVLTTMPDDIDAQKQALDDLANAYLDQTELMQNLTEENKDYVISELKKIDIENAEEYVESRLNDTTKQLLSNLSKFGKVYAENYNAIKNATKGSEEYKQSLQNLKDGLNELLSYEIDGEMFSFDVSDNFVVENLEDIEAAANGSVDALNRVKLAATQDYVMNMSINAPSTAEADYIRQQINDLISDFDIQDLKIGASLDDTQLIAGLNHYLKAGSYTANQMNQILSGIGVEPKITYTTATIDSPVFENGNRTGYEKIEFRIPKINYIVARGAGASYVGGYGGGSSSGGGGGGSSSENETSETFDWIEVKINRLEEAIARLDKTVNNTYDNWANRNTALSSEMSKVREEINLQQQAYSRYKQEANKVGLSADYVKKIQSGELNIQTIKDQNLLDKINLYREWYDKAIACSDAIQDLSINLGDLAQQSFDNVTQEYSDFISLIEGSADIIDERINRLYFLYQNKEINVIDVRQKEKFQEYHIPGSINFPGFLSIKKKHEMLSKNKTYYVIDYNDEFAEEICNDLVNEGYHAVRVFGGIKKWKGDFK
jgi:rhodanese-related sulfurtransferase